VLFRSGQVFTDCNEAAVRVFRCPARDSLIGVHPAACSPERQPDGLLSSEKMREAMKTTLDRGSNRFEWVYRTFDNEEFWVEISHTVIPIRGRRTVYVVCRDIGEHKKAEEALRKAEEKYHNIIENAVEGILQATPDGRFLSANPFLARMYGYDSPQELMAAVTDIGAQLHVDPTARKRFMEILEREGFIENFETERRRKDGSTLWTSANAWVVRDAEGRVIYYEGTLQDITDRKRAEEALRAENRQLVDIIEFFPDATLAIDINGKVIAWNKAMEKLTGVGKEEMLGKDDHAYAVPFYGEPRPMAIDLVLGADEGVARAYAFMHRDGNVIFGEAYIPIRNRHEAAYLSAAVCPPSTETGTLSARSNPSGTCRRSRACSNNCGNPRSATGRRSKTRMTASPF
jgi:PAS domain S-box-containing protein